MYQLTSKDERYWKITKVFERYYAELGKPGSFTVVFTEWLLQYNARWYAPKDSDYYIEFESEKAILSLLLKEG